MSSIRETLAQLDQRLEDLRQQVARLSERPVGPGELGEGDRGAISVARLPSGGAPASTVPVLPETQLEIQELLVACNRLLGEARGLVGERGAEQARPALFEERGTEQARPALFEGTVTLVAVGAGGVQTIEVLEDSLSRAGHVARTYVRHAHAGEVRLELTLAGGVDLVGELNRVMPFPFAVRSVAREEIVISLEGGGLDA